ncbi:Uncharacterised protein [Shigella sonnei]|nr:Uncharacterised protein [Shigella sonnei]CSE85882.1 Uncharacterised protein [Shigella sonnei]CSF01598.1 Uncharacterised protein [Shigella sonnei]CSG34602.1 Uncharacterised protein [Shigella sonnei]CSP24209.1 Uncharacterised protein [Shigella sonnei]
MHNKSANGYATKSANRLISLPCKRRYGRWSGKASSPATFGHRYAPSPAAVPTHAPQLAAVTGLVVDVLSMRNPSRRWYLTTHQIWLDAGAGGKYARPLRHHQSSGGDSRKYPWRVSIDANALSKYGRLRANYARSFCRRSGWRAIR